MCGTLHPCLDGSSLRVRDRRSGPRTDIAGAEIAQGRDKLADDPAHLRQPASQSVSQIGDSRSQSKAGRSWPNDPAHLNLLKSASHVEQPLQVWALTQLEDEVDFATTSHESGAGVRGRAWLEDGLDFASVRPMRGPRPRAQ